MGIGVSGLLNIGKSSLLSNQVAINVTGNNIANVNTSGYTRQSVNFSSLTSIDHNPGQLGTGVYIQEIYRNFDRFLENSFLDQNSNAQMWAEQSTVLSSVENLFNEANSSGIHDQMSEFFSNWSNLSTSPDSLATREALLVQAQTLTALINSTTASMDKYKIEMDNYIKSGVDTVNSLLEQIGEVNKQIAAHYNPPVNNANTLLDTRDALVRELSTYVDLSVQDNGPRDFSIFLKEGMPLLEDQTIYSIDIDGPFYENDTKNFTGELHFEGSDANEYILEFINGTDFKVSLDGGKTWATDLNGNNTFTVPPVGEKLAIGDLKISFSGGGYEEGETPTFDIGDKFYIVPKDTIKWNQPTRDPINVSKTITGDSIGGKLGAYINVRDESLSEYQTRLDAMAQTLIWEVNRAHSQGAGIDPFTQIVGMTKVDDYNLPLGSPWQNIEYSQRLEAGNLTMHFYDNEGNQLKSGELNFSDVPGEFANFDPEKHSLNDVVAAINRSYVDDSGKPLITASVQGGVLQLNAAEGVNFKMGADTTGVWAALGVNTFFSGDNAGTIEINPYLLENPKHVNAHAIDGQGQGNEGDGLIASLIAKLSNEDVTIHTTWGSKKESLLNNYAGLVGLVGADTRNANFNADYYGTLAKELENSALSKTGVNLDEEMVSLVQFQSAYTAAAKLITTADEMFQTVLGLKQ